MGWRRRVKSLRLEERKSAGQPKPVVAKSVHIQNTWGKYLNIQTLLPFPKILIGQGWRDAPKLGLLSFPQGIFVSFQAAGLSTFIGRMWWGWPGLGQKQERVPEHSRRCPGLLLLAPGCNSIRGWNSPTTSVPQEHTLAQWGASWILRASCIPAPATPAASGTGLGPADPKSASPLTLDAWSLASHFAGLFIYLLFPFLF